MRKTIFHEDWWLDAVAPGRWRETSVQRGGRVVGSLRFVERMMGNYKICEMPQITRVLGPVVISNGEKSESRLRFGHSVLQELLESIGHHDHVEMTLEPALEHLPAFLAADFDLRVLPTLVLDCARPMDDLWSGMRDKTRNVVRRARERLTVREVTDPNAFIACYLANLRGDPPYFDVELVRPLYDAAVARGQARMLSAVDSNDAVHAAALFIWDSEKLYYFLSTRDRDVADIGAVSLLIWHGIEIAHQLGLVFDFDGVTTESRYRFMAAFGGETETRFMATRTTSAFETQRQLRGIARSILKPEWMRRPRALAATAH